MTNIDIYEECTGQIGRWQIIAIVLLSVMRIPISWHQLSIVFLAPIPDFECSDLDLDKCSPSCPMHIFSIEENWETIVTKWDLVCDNQYLVTLTQSISMIGMLVGSFIIGFLSDIFGRKIPLIFSIAILTLTGIGTAFAPWFWLFLTLKFIASIAVGGITLNTFVLTMELIGKSYRTSAGSLFHTPFYLGYGLLGLLGYLIRNWQYLQFTISIVSIISLSYFLFIPESPRWLLISGKSDEAIELMQKGAKVNHLSTYGIKEKVQNFLETKSKEESIKAAFFVDLFRTRNMRIRSISMIAIYFCIFFVYFGVSLYLGEIGNPYVNIGISGLIQIPGAFICIYLMNKFGRKRTIILGNIFSSLCCFLILVIPDGMDWGYTILGALGILFNGIVITANYIYSGELFPTTVRSLGIGACSTFAKIASAVAPFIIALKLEFFWVPPVVLGILSLLACLFCFKLPETLNQKLPDTVEEIENFNSNSDEKIVYVMQ